VFCDAVASGSVLECSVLGNECVKASNISMFGIYVAIRIVIVEISMAET